MKSLITQWQEWQERRKNEASEKLEHHLQAVEKETRAIMRSRSVERQRKALMSDKMDRLIELLEEHNCPCCANRTNRRGNQVWNSSK